MFLHLCLLAAGLHYGRRLIARGRSTSEETAIAAPAPSQAEAAALVRQEIKAQFDLSLVCMGLATVSRLLLPQLRLLSGAVVLAAGAPIMRRAREQLLDERRVGAEVLDTVCMLTTVAGRHYVSSAFMFFLHAGGRQLRVMTERDVHDSLVDAFGHQTELIVWVRRGEVELGVPLASLQVGDIAVVDAGSLVPADGVVVDGLALVDQHALTGASQPVERGVGERVFAATVVTSGRIHVRVETTGEATVAAEIAGLLGRTAALTDALEADDLRLADALALPTLALATLAYPLVGPQGSVALLNANFLDSMHVFTPLSMLAHLRRAADAGMLIKDGRSLQTLPAVDTVVFDKTGTLTLGQLRVRRVDPAPGVAADDLVRLAAAAEQRQAHPIARAIVDEARRRDLLVAAADSAELELGYGLTARVGRRTIRVGSRRFMANHRVAVPEDPGRPDDDHLRIASRVYVAAGRTLLGALELEPTLRPDVERLVADLRARGLALYLVSGDHPTPTRELAETLGLDRWFAEVLPADKARLVADLQASGRTVCFVGDGLNDCLALERAAVSVSLHGASAPARDSAQIVLDDVAALPALFDAGAELRQTLRELMLSLGVPSAVAVAGVFLAGFRVPAITSLYSVSMLAGLAVATPSRQHRGRADLPAPEPAPDPTIIDISELSAA